MRIPLYKIYWDENDVEAVVNVLRRGMYWTGGTENEQLEDDLARYIGRKHGVAFNSGTSALTALLLAYGLNPGDEVIVPSFTYAATIDAVVFVGAKPVFADIEKENYGLDTDDVEERITDRTKAIIAVHIYGLPCHIIELQELANRHGFILIEDAAEAIGASIIGRKAGSFGDAAIFSFSGNKIITTGEGGMAITNSSEIYDKLKQIRQMRSWRMSSIQAALGISQLKKLDSIINMRGQKARYLSNQLQKIEGLQVPFIPDGYSHTYQFYTIRFKKDRDGLKKYLEDRGITTKIYFPSLQYLPVTEIVTKEVLTLPIYPSIKIEEMDYIVESIRDFADS